MGVGSDVKHSYYHDPDRLKSGDDKGSYLMIENVCKLKVLMRDMGLEVSFSPLGSFCNDPSASTPHGDLTKIEKTEKIKSFFKRMDEADELKTPGATLMVNSSLLYCWATLCGFQYALLPDSKKAWGF